MRRQDRPAVEMLSHAFGCSTPGYSSQREGDGWIIRCKGCGRAAWTDMEPKR